MITLRTPDYRVPQGYYFAESTIRTSSYTTVAGSWVFTGIQVPEDEYWDLHLLSGVKSTGDRDHYGWKLYYSENSIEIDYLTTASSTRHAYEPNKLLPMKPGTRIYGYQTAGTTDGNWNVAVLIDVYRRERR